MTTIAYRDGIMAGDGRETLTENGEADGYVLNDKCKKVVRLPDGSLFGGRGVSVEINRVLDALLAQKKKLPKGDCDCMMVTPDGVISVRENGDRKFRPIEKNLKFYAIGSGARYAIAAMKANADARRAVEIATEMDIWSGGTITTLPLKEADKPTE